MKCWTIKVLYEDDYVSIELGEILTNRSITTEEALNSLGIDLEEWAQEQGWDGVDYECVTFKNV